MAKAVLIMGAGKIGTLMACFLASTKKYKVYLADNQIKSLDLNVLGDQKSRIALVTLDAAQKSDVAQFVQDKQIVALVSCLPYFCNVAIAEIARLHHCHYFDLTEDVAVAKAIHQIAEGAQSAFVPQCGLAPGLVSMIAKDMMRKFDKIDTVSMRVGALPENTHHALKYSLTWSVDGMLNEYGNTCYGIVNGKITPLQPLEGLEILEIDGESYEAFNTSGGLGALADSSVGQVNTMTYKTLRYPGHCHYMRFLMNDLKLNEDRETLKRILERALPQTLQDVVIIYVAVQGYKNSEWVEDIFVKKIYSQEILGYPRSAIQIATAASACAVVDSVLGAKKPYSGLVLQEAFDLKEIMESRFGQYYAV